MTNLAAARQRRVSPPLVGWLLLVSGALLFGAGGMTWASVLDISVAGTQGDGGRVTVFFGVVLVVLGLLIGLRQGRLWVPITACVLATLVVLIALTNMANLKNLTDGETAALLGNKVSIGAGLWLTLIVGIGALVLSVVGIARRPVQAK